MHIFLLGLLGLACTGTAHPDGGDTTDSGEPALDSGDTGAACPPGEALFVGDDGASSSWTEQLAAGTESAPVAVRLDQPGRLELCAGTWYVNLTVAADAELVGAGGEHSVLSGGGTVRVIDLVDGAAVGLHDLALADGVGDQGGAIRCPATSSLELDGVTVRGGVAELGGGLWADNCGITLVGGTFDGNTGGVGAGIFAYESAVAISGTVFRRQVASRDGGGVALLNSSGTLDEACFEDNAVGDHGGGLHTVSSTVSIVGGVFRGNDAAEDGGAISITNGSSAELEGVSLSANTALYGGGMYIDSKSVVSLAEVTVTDNAAAVQGGGLYLLWGGQLSLDRARLGGNRAGEGGGVWLDAASTVEAVVTDFEDNEPEAVFVEGVGGFGYGEDESFTCDGSGCGEP